VNIVITMAGFGSRFRDAGYDVPKYAIEARGKSLFAWSMDSLRNFFPACEKMIFVVRGEENAGPFIESELARFGSLTPDIVSLDRATDGQATSALEASAVWSLDSPLLIYNIDTHVDPNFLKPEMIKGDGWIPCVRVPGDHWSFVRLNAEGDAVEVREKRRISDLASIGLYWFASARLFETSYQAYYQDDHPDLPERYIAPIYNVPIRNGLRVTSSEVPVNAMTPLGTPDELRRFVAGQTVNTR
jgi:choline kinase